MGYKVDDKATAIDVNSLKALINAECTRRNKTGSVAAYGEGDWASFNHEVAKDVTIYQDVANKLYTPINKIAGTPTVPTKGTKISITALYNKYIELHEQTDSRNSSGATGCSGSCTGFCSGCSGTCASGCTSCTNSCSASCGGCGWCWSCAANGSSDPCGAAGTA